MKSDCQRTFSSSNLDSKFLAVVRVYCDFFNCESSTTAYPIFYSYIFLSYFPFLSITAIYYSHYITLLFDDYNYFNNLFNSDYNGLIVSTTLLYFNVALTH